MTRSRMFALAALPLLAAAAIAPPLLDLSTNAMLGIAALVGVVLLLGPEAARLVSRVPALLAMLVGAAFLSACAPVVSRVVPVPIADQVALLSCDEARAAFGQSAGVLAANGVETVLSGGFSAIVAVASAIASGGITAENAETATAAGIVVATAARLRTCAALPIEVEAVL